MNSLEEIHKKIKKSDTGFCLHYHFLYSLVLGLECKSVFEFGSGFSTHCILKALSQTGGNLISCDTNTIEKNGHITEYSQNSKNWQLVVGNSNSTVPNINHNYYDLILHDGSHIATEVLVDLNNIYPYLKNDGILITHDTRHYNLGGEMMSAVESFVKDKDIEMLTLPYGYGSTIIRNKANKKNKVDLTWLKR